MDFHAWQVTPSAHSLAVTMDLTEGVAPELRIVDSDPLDAAVEETLAAAEADPSRPHFLPPDLVLRLETESEALTLHYADIGYRLVSRDLRDALGLADDEIQYLPVDARRCPRPTQVMDYRWLHLPHIAEPFDIDRSDGEIVDVFAGTTTLAHLEPPRQRWRLRVPAPGFAPRIVWRADFIPPAPLFQTLGLPWTLATREIVGRNSEPSMTDLRFVDVARERW